MDKNHKKDFRIELYHKYVSSFKYFIENEDPRAINSDYKIYKKWYLPLIKNFSKDASIIDIGCGAGRMLQFLKMEGYTNTFGIDISEEQVKKAKNKELNVKVHNYFDFASTSPQKYDIIFALDFVEHFYRDEMIELFRGINSFLNENGILIIHTPNGDGLFPQHIIYGDLTHLTIFNSNSLAQLLRSTGFNQIECFETGPVTKNMKGLIRLLLWKIIRLLFQFVRIIETGRSEKILTQEIICVSYKNLNKK
jgi:2-polyprenyl-3-methyl-5-hydroxy-6-metoxy-1,4-benzoquinol methylase